MLDALRFVAASVARKDYVPELTHFKIVGGRISGFNGVIGLSSPIDLDLDIYPNAQKLLAAVRACKEVVSFHVTPAGRLAIKSGKFSSYVDCIKEDLGHFFVEPDGETVATSPAFMEGLRRLAPLMGVDASRPWSMGIMITGKSLLVTNNTILAECWVGDQFPIQAVIPAAAVEELLRINEDPVSMQATENSITFHFEGDRWMKTALVDSAQWPIEIVKRILNQPWGELTPMPEGFSDSVATLKNFLDDDSGVYIFPDRISTSMTEGVGTSVELTTGVPSPQSYHHRNLVILGQVAEQIEWGSYPSPCAFTAKGLRGRIVGRRLGTGE